MRFAVLHFRLLPVVMLAVLLTGLAASVGNAQSAGVDKVPQSEVLKVKKAAKVAFDWHANGQKTRISPAAQRKAVENANKVGGKGATWICSPAGFGKKSRCHAG